MTAPAAGAAALAATVDRLATDLVALYAAAEQQLLQALAVVARHGLQDSGAGAQLVTVIEMRRAAQRAVNQIRLHSGPLARQVAEQAAAHGQTSAAAMLERIVAGDARLAAQYLPRRVGISGHALAAANAIGLDLARTLDATQPRILRFADDAYRAATADAATRLVLGREALTPATAQGLAWNELTRSGVTGYTDTRGRQWNLASYVEMAARSATQRSFNVAHLDQMTSVGIDYFTVPGDGHPCPLCRPWEGSILSLSHVGPVNTTAADDGRPVSFTVAATVEQAIAAGFQHPNCRHTLTAYLPGVTQGHAPREWTDADQARYDATQQLRSLERQVRAAKREQLGALDDLSRQRAARKVRAIQARIRAHVAAHDLVRRTRREQLDLGNKP